MWTKGNTEGKRLIKENVNLIPSKRENMYEFNDQTKNLQRRHADEFPMYTFDEKRNPYNPTKPKEEQLAYFRKPENLFNDSSAQKSSNGKFKLHNPDLNSYVHITADARLQAQ